MRNRVVLDRGTLVIAQEIQVSHHGWARHFQCGTEILGIRMLPESRTFPNHGQYAANPLILGP
jgi:hypothetical protein